jgi:hypothetical protein
MRVCSGGHYDSIVKAGESPGLLRTAPGVCEDAAIARSRRARASIAHHGSAGEEMKAAESQRLAL